ncbi:Lysosomal Pro-X carboxypeptidase [Micractinium conductrix]|uniref:Lysosomal Pro-X carboxypeptidase n=1 Tax=Micractinium conductrix TaxID=554055 RepID=A0A2P6V8M9_9CHLO|nr:Lysosomal Pro-X carboxypeptidase [Micractinium conductrix]|eukprot:PSC70433.1 Lysosomal Pro-X carboxypeptidase [Micractinium conductrix]
MEALVPPADVDSVPAHAHLWLKAEEQADWVTFKTQVPALVLGSFVAFNVLSALSIRIINRKKTIKAASNCALLQHGATAATHALLCLAAASYASMHRELGRCGGRSFCWDDMAGRMLTVHAGFALYEILFWQNNASLVQPWNEMIFLHNLLTLLTALASLMYPCRLTLLVLPVQQMLAIATLADCARRTAAVYGASWGLRFKLQLGFMLGQGVRALGGIGVSAFTYWWIRQNNLWKFELPEGMSALNSVYGMLMLAGGIIQALIYLKWVGAALAMTNDLIEGVQGGKKGGAAAAAAGGAATPSKKKETLVAGGRTRSAKKERQRRWATTKTFEQRYFFCDEHWAPGGAIFFYLGNEADVTLYLNNTGLMWELAPRHQALLVFPEHRYYGQSKPFEPKKLRKHMHWLTTEQAMADYAQLLWELKEELGDPDVPVIGFGGSYGGMLGAWFRMKYPHLMDGVIAASAPIWTYLGESPPSDSGAFARIVTQDASAEGGSVPACADNVDVGGTDDGRRAIGVAMRLCPESSLDSQDDVTALRDWAASAWDYLAMGNYPFPSSYIVNGALPPLPAFPVRAACEHLASPDLPSDPAGLLGALGRAVGVFYNHTGDLACLSFKEGPNPETDEDSKFWGYQYCTEQWMPFSKDGEHDMFWSEPWDNDAAVAACKETWGVTPRPLWATVQWGGKKLGAASNIVFSNGLLDPWSGGGVLGNVSAAKDVVAVIIPEGAHHLDLMFSNPADPPSVKEARAVEESYIAKWISEARNRPALPPLLHSAAYMAARSSEA